MTYDPMMNMCPYCNDMHSAPHHGTYECPNCGLNISLGLRKQMDEEVQEEVEEHDRWR